MKTRRQGGFLVAKAHRLAGRVFSRLLREQEIEINSSQGRILFSLWREDGVPIGDLARATGLRKSTLTSMLDRLEAQGHVVRIPDAVDRRTIRIARTQKDRALEAEYRRVSDRMTGLFYRGLSDEEIDQFERYLGRIVANLERVDEAAPGWKTE